jgi:hypothetical protein
VDPTVGAWSYESVSGTYPAFDEEVGAAATGCDSGDGREHAATSVVIAIATETG